jgi:lauroyl/myristoyl acyltransferase
MGKLQDAVDLAMFRALGVMPTPAASAVGAALGAMSGPLFHRVGEARAHTALERIRPEVNLAGRKLLTRRMWRHIGRVFTEFSRMRRLNLEGRIDILGGHELLQPGQPVVLAASHTGNWETIAIAAIMLRHNVGGIYMPQRNALRTRLAEKERADVGWSGFPTTAPDAMRRCVTHLRAGNVLVLYVDEYKSSVVQAPRFGRDIPLNGNIRLAAKLAKRYDAALVFGDCVRLPGPRFRVAYTPIATDGVETDDLVKRLDQMLETSIRARPEQWFNLHAMRF